MQEVKFSRLGEQRRVEGKGHRRHGLLEDANNGHKRVSLLASGEIFAAANVELDQEVRESGDEVSRRQQSSSHNGTSLQEALTAEERQGTHDSQTPEVVTEVADHESVDHVFATSAIANRTGEFGGQSEIATLQLASERWELESDEIDSAVVAGRTDGADEVSQARFASFSAATAFTAFYGIRAFHGRSNKQRQLAMPSN